MTRLTLAILMAAGLGGCYLNEGYTEGLVVGMSISVLLLVTGSLTIVMFRDWWQWITWSITAIGLGAILAACSVHGAEIDLRETRETLCQIESRTFARPDIAVSDKGAVGYCQVLPETAAWVVRHAVRGGYLSSAFLVFYDKPEAWEWLLQVRYVNESIADAYLQWMWENRTQDTRTLLYKYHAGHNARLRRGTESWRHSDEVYTALFPHTRPPHTPQQKMLALAR